MRENRRWLASTELAYCLTHDFDDENYQKLSADEAAALRASLAQIREDNLKERRRVFARNYGIEEGDSITVTITKSISKLTVRGNQAQELLLSRWLRTFGKFSKWLFLLRDEVCRLCCREHKATVGEIVADPNLH
jgi:hypothetical protein